MRDCTTIDPSRTPRRTDRLEADCRRIDRSVTRRDAYGHIGVNETATQGRASNSTFDTDGRDGIGVATNLSAAQAWTTPS